jgi:hypothetical protein
VQADTVTAAKSSKEEIKKTKEEKRMGGGTLASSLKIKTTVLKAGSLSF